MVSVVSHQTKEKKQVTTSADGSYYFDNLKTGNYKVIFEKDGYKSLIKDTVFIREDENRRVKKSSRIACGLYIEVRAFLRDFEQLP